MEFITSGPLIAMVLEGENAVQLTRNTMGSTNPADASPGTIRGDMAVDLGRNLIHGSDSADSAKRETAIFFSPDEVLCYDRDVEPWIRES